MNELLGYFENEVVWSRVQEELEYYNQNREKVLKACIEFEEAVYSKHGTQMNNLKTGNYISHYNFLSFYTSSIYKLQESFLHKDGTIKFVEIRNKFLHNQIINNRILLEIFPDLEFDSTLITKQVIDKTIAVYSQLKNSI